VDLTNKGITGKEAETALDKAGITVNKNLIPFDEKSPFVTSGIRLGTPAATTRGMKEKEMEKIVEFMDKALRVRDDDKKLEAIRLEIKAMLKDFPLYDDWVKEMETL
jgi:glycine hydroxymethyltransferase